MVKKILSRFYMALIFLFLYMPIFVLIVLSFNNSDSRVNWGGFTLSRYVNCFHSETIMTAFATTLEITLISAIVATLIGTLAAIGISAMKKRNQTIYLGATNIPLLNADIVTGISMMLLFVKFTNLGFVTVLIAHITFNIPYVILNVLPKLKQANRSTYEAALDLGASPLKAFFTVTWPEIRSGVFSGFLMAVTMSLDDFSITYFTKGAGVNTLSTMLYAQLRKGIKPEIYALSTILFFTVLLLLIAVNLNSQKEPIMDVKVSERKIRRIKRGNITRRIVSVAIIFILVIGSVFVFVEKKNLSGKGSKTLTVLNYGKYIDEGLVQQFEEETGIIVKYEEYEEPEEMYTKYKAGSISYDLICTSDYIIEKLINEEELLTIDYQAMENYDNIDQTIIDMSTFDPTHEYTVPYFYGTLGILYNTKVYSEEDVKTWDLIWDTNLTEDLIMTNSVRDAFAPALITLGYSLNDTNPDHLAQAQKLLLEQKPQVSAYYVDETADEMIAENAALAVCYSGEAALAMDENENLNYYVPDEGSNLWIDSWFIPKSCENYDEAIAFLDFLCQDEEALVNFDYVYYASPILYVQENMDIDDRLYSAINPSSDIILNCEVYSALDDEIAAYVNTLWQQIKSQ